jgi:hypothetical protein
MIDKAFMKRWQDGRQVVVVNLDHKEGVSVRIGDEYRILTAEEWRVLPLFNPGDAVAQGS